jgi:anti-sigma regulatory factor (Ser/Thr protein kinase)
LSGAVPGSPFALELPAVPESVSRARRAVVAYGERFNADPDKLALATSEAVTNVVRHAYRGEKRGPIRLLAEPDGEDLVVVVSDDGIGMTPDPHSGGLGLGLPLIAALTSEVKLDSSESGLRISMRFPCRPGA